MAIGFRPLLTVLFDDDYVGFCACPAGCDEGVELESNKDDMEMLFLPEAIS